MKPVVVKKTSPRPTDAKRKFDDWEAAVFDAATVFTSVTRFGRGPLDRREFATPTEAMDDALGRERTVVYAAAPNGRAIVLDRARWGYWLERYIANRCNAEVITLEPENPVMTYAFLLYWNGRGPSHFDVMRFASKAEAETYANEHLPGDYTAHVIADVLDLNDRAFFSGSVLIAIFNTLTGDDPGVKRFESLEYARTRVFGMLQKRYGTSDLTTLPEPREAQPTKEKTMSATQTAERPKAGADGHARNPGRGRRQFPDNAKIVVLAKENPKRAGSAAFDRFTLYRTGMLVKTFLDKGGLLIDLAYDVKHEYVQVNVPESD